MPVLPVRIRTMRYLKPPLIDFFYPVVEGLGDSAVEQRINHQIVSQMYKLIAELQQPGLTTQVTGYYEIKANERNVLSLILSAMGEFGGAHPMTIVHALNIDVATGSNYPLGTMFKPGSDYVTILSDIIRVQIAERNLPLLGEYPGIQPNQEYYMADNVLVIFYQLFEIMPYAAGFPYFPIPIYKIEPIVAETSLLNRLTGII
ncbi:MAG TPA: DUF3298 and DUF4163 domain-containing protein [Clostridiales bacterium]|nr:DUF3298 and DUF4163 domain-containing protein [Clostridiales bacterium]